MVVLLAVAFVLMVTKMGLKLWQGVIALLFGFYLAKNKTWGPMVDDLMRNLFG